MAIIDARILWPVKVTQSKSEKGSIQLSATQEFLILSDVRNPSFSEIMLNTATWPNLSNTRLPAIDDYITISGVQLYVTSRELSYYKDNERAVVMSVRYDAKDRDAGGDGDPLSDRDAWLRVQVQSVDVQVPARGWRSLLNTRDISERSSQPAINSAGDPVDGLEQESSMLRFTYTNTVAVNPNFMMLQHYTNKCNFDVMQVLDISCSFYTLRCTGFNAAYDQKNNVWSVTVELLYNPKGWEIRFYDAGFNEVINGERHAILDRRGNPVSSPVGLDGNGRAATVRVINESDPEVGPAVRLLYPYVSTDLTNLFRDANI